MKKFSIFMLISLIFIISCQGSFIYHPEKSLHRNPDHINLPYESVDFYAADSISLHGWYVPSVRERGVVLFCHGNGGNISHRLDTIRILNNLGFTVFIFDYRGYGKSNGTPTEEGTYLDAMAAWNYLREIKGIPAEKIIVHGRSLGGAIAVWLAANSEPAALIVESSFTSAVDVAKSMTPFQLFSWVVTYRYSAVDYIKDVKCPILVIHSQDDRLIPFELGRNLYLAAPGFSEFVEIQGGHNSGFLVSKEIYTSGLDKFFKSAGF